ncbi:ATP-binding protein [Streptomyces sp. NPDC101118]|uniref:ATP-binding protein n=1 Tax=Streptomyces sp. NPDC101118 TaxID=3366109 RepID=UPI0037F639B5
MSEPERHPTAPVRVFTQRFSSTRRGARLARRLALLQLHDWGIPHRTSRSVAAEQVLAELAANAITHGRVAGRDFEVRLTLTGGGAVLRIEVADARGDRRPEIRVGDGVSGYGMRLVDAYADAWGVTDRVIGKTVWAELGASLSPPALPSPHGDPLALLRP